MLRRAYRARMSMNAGVVPCGRGCDVDRQEWQRIADERLQAAATLLSANLWSSAYYVAGYAVECGLKSCILVRVAAGPEVLFEPMGKKFFEKCWTHDVAKLVDAAGLDSEHGNDVAARPDFGKNWAVVANWSEQSRYQTKTESEARELYAAIADAPDGVMAWIRSRW